MGLFDYISKNINNAKRKAMQEAEEFERRIKDCDFERVTMLFVEQYEHTSLMGRPRITRIYRNRLEEETDQNTMYYTFERLYKSHRHTFDMPVSQLIGKRLYDMGCSDVEEKETSEGKTIYRPTY